jgi:hypothetical protein
MDRFGAKVMRRLSGPTRRPKPTERPHGWPGGMLARCTWCVLLVVGWEWSSQSAMRPDGGAVSMTRERVKGHGGRLMTMQCAETVNRVPRQKVKANPLGARPENGAVGSQTRCARRAGRQQHPGSRRARSVQLRGANQRVDAMPARSPSLQALESAANGVRAGQVRPPAGLVVYGFGAWLPEKAPRSPCMAAGAFTIFVPGGTTNKFGS